MKDLAYYKARLIDAQIARGANELAHLMLGQEIDTEINRLWEKIREIESKVLVERK